VSDGSGEDTTTDEDTDTAFRGRTGETSGTEPDDTTTDTGGDDDDDTAFRGRTGETSGRKRDDDDVEPVEVGGDLGPTGDPEQQTATSGREDTTTPVEVEEGDMPKQTGPTGPESTEGLEETGETQPIAGSETDVSEREIAQRVEEQVLQEREELAAEDIAVVGGIEEGIDVVLTEGAEREFRAERVGMLADSLAGRPEEIQRGFESEEELLRTIDAEERQAQETRSELLRSGVETTSFTQADAETIDGRQVQETIQGTAEFYEATTEGGFLSEEQEATLTNLSDRYQSDVVDPVAGAIGAFGVPFEAPTEEGRAIQQQEQLKYESVARGVGQFADPFQVAKGVETGAEVGQSVFQDIADLDYQEFRDLGVSAGAVGAVTAREISQAYETAPMQTYGQLLGGFGAGAATAGIAPVRISRVDIPDVEGGSQTIRGLQVGYPRGYREVLRPGARTTEFEQPRVLQSRTRTVAGTRGYRPAIGTPQARAERIAFSELGTRADEAFEPTGQFETQVFRSTFESEGAGQTAARIEAVKDLIDQGASSRQRAELEISETEDIVRRAENVPEGEEARVAQAIEESEGAIFGSAAVESQLPGFRRGYLEEPAPKDIDVIVPDEEAARGLRQAEQDIGEDIFDIKTFEEAPGRARGGEPIKFGQQSQEMLFTEEGVPVNPVSEELVRKAGASGFFRGTDAPERGEFDIGPQPQRPGKLTTREKDVLDALAIGEELLGPEQRKVRQFRGAFEDIGGIDAPPQRTLRERLNIDELMSEERAQAGLQGRRTARGIGDDATQRPRRLREPDTDIDSPIMRQRSVSPGTASALGSAIGIGGAISPGPTTPPEINQSPVAGGIGVEYTFGPSPFGDGADTAQSPVTFDVDVPSPGGIGVIDDSPSPGDSPDPQPAQSPGDTIPGPGPTPTPVLDSPLRESEPEGKDKDEEPGLQLLGGKERYTFDFIDPLSGEVIQT
jgi:hypothetical protein